jgi:hypothetical protein
LARFADFFARGRAGSGESFETNFVVVVVTASIPEAATASISEAIFPAVFPMVFAAVIKGLSAESLLELFLLGIM